MPGRPRAMSLNRVLPSTSSRTISGVHRSASTSVVSETGQNRPYSGMPHGRSAAAGGSPEVVPARSRTCTGTAGPTTRTLVGHDALSKTPVPTASSTAPPPSRPSWPSTPAATTSRAPSCSEALDALRDAGLLAAGVPVELGGLGADNRALADLQRELAHHCGSTALATSMHQHVVCFTAWRYRRGLPGAEATLRRVAEEGIVLVSTGGGDWTHPRGEPPSSVDGGYQVSGHKRFASQSTVGTAMSTMATYDDPEQGRRVLNLAVPFAVRGRQRARQLGHPRHARRPPATTSCSRTSSCPTSGCWPTGRTASSTRRCR